jgi:hypothetical protein
MTYTYNRTKHIELLKRAQELKNQGKLLFHENPEEDAELLQYDVVVERHIIWQDRDQIALLMEDFLNQKIDGEEMCGRVYGIRRTLRNKVEKFQLELISNSEKMNDFQPDERSKTIGGFWTGLFCECDSFSEDYENPEFYTLIQNGFLNFQKAFIEE